MGHFYMENICTMDEQRKCELKIIAGKIGWILLIAQLGSLILMRIMPIFAENMAFYIFWAGIVWMGMKKWGRLSLLDTCYSKNKYELSVLEKGLLTAFVIFLSHVFCSFFATVYKGNIIKNLIMDCQSYTKYRPNETTGGIFVSWRRKEELPTGA